MFEALNEFFGKGEERKDLKIEDVTKIYGEYASTKAGGSKNFMLDKMQDFYSLEQSKVALIDDGLVYKEALKGRSNPLYMYNELMRKQRSKIESILQSFW